jgi:phosphoenolpyruvate synthase/pyruvate phosphate dikinase
VLLTLDPLTGDRSQVTIEAAYGLGVAVVEGEVAPDRFAVDKVTMELRSRTVGEVIELAGLGKRVEQALGVPQDIEWAVAPPAPGGTTARREVWLLQARPETVWSRRPRQAVGPPGSSVMDRMLGYLGRPGRSEPG